MADSEKKPVSERQLITSSDDLLNSSLRKEASEVGENTGKESGTKVIKYHPIKKQILCYTLILAFITGMCWGGGAIVFISVEALHRDITFRSNSARFADLQLNVMSFGGALTFVTGVIGLWGSLHLEHQMICGFSYVVYVTAIIQISMGAVIISFKGSSIRENILKLVKNEVHPWEGIFQIQKELHCCGWISPDDWLETRWWQAERKSNTSFVVPGSCCVPMRKDIEYKICNKGLPPYKRLQHPHLIHQTGCRHAVLCRRNFLMTQCGIVSCVMGFFQLVAFLIIHYLANYIVSLQRESAKQPYKMKILTLG